MRREGESVNIFIDNRNTTPIYDQIYAQIKAQIMSGALGEDAALPSIRNLAKDLRISVITTSAMQTIFLMALPATSRLCMVFNVRPIRLPPPLF